MTNHKDDLVNTICDSLMNIAAVSGVAAKHLRHRQSLEVDLAFDDAAFLVLAASQRDVGNRLRNDGMNTRIEADDLRDLLVWQVLQVTIARATGRTLARDEVLNLATYAQAELRAGRRR
jgi:hypothetical protein